MMGRASHPKLAILHLFLTCLDMSWLRDLGVRFALLPQLSQRSSADDGEMTDVQDPNT
jgi:hypothetical protein